MRNAHYSICLDRRAAATTTTSNFIVFTRAKQTTSFEIYSSSATSFNWLVQGYKA